VTTEALAFDCTNFDSYAGAKTRSRLLQRGHSKSGRSLRMLGMGLLVSEDDGMPLLTFAYPGNQNDVTAFKRFLHALDRRHDVLQVSLDTTVAADGGNISKQILGRLEKSHRHYVLRLPARHAGTLSRSKRSELPALVGRFKGKVWAKKHLCEVYGRLRCVVEAYSRRMHLRQLPGLERDRRQAREQLQHLQELLERQRRGQRRYKPLTVAAVKRRADAALAREHTSPLAKTDPLLLTKTDPPSGSGSAQPGRRRWIPEPRSIRMIFFDLLP
jgi:transposase